MGSGREETVRKLVAAATALFGARGPDAVSLREVAAAAGVNYGLIHQYVGTKDDLLELTLRHVSAVNAEQFAADSVDEVLQRLVRRPGEISDYVRMLCWALLQGREPGKLLGRSPALTQLEELVGEPDEADQRVAIVATVALGFGWQLIGEMLAAGIGLDAAAATDDVRDLARRLLTDTVGV